MWFKRFVIIVTIIIVCSGCSPKEKNQQEVSAEIPEKNEVHVTEVQRQLIARLVDAAGKGDMQGVIESLAAGADINGLNSKNMSALMEASLRGHIQIVDLLVKKGVDIYLRNNDRQDAMRFAVVYDHPEIVKLLIENGEDVSTVNDRNRYLLWSAAHNKTPEMLKILLANGLKVDQYYRDDNDTTPLHPAANRCRLENMQILIKEGVLIDLHDKFDRNTPLIAAAWINCTEAIILLVDSGADVNNENKLGDTALCYVARRANLKAVEYLIQHGADPNHKNSEGNTAVDFALEMVELHPSQKMEYNKVIQLLKQHM